MLFFGKKFCINIKKEKIILVDRILRIYRNCKIPLKANSLLQAYFWFLQYYLKLV